MKSIKQITLLILLCFLFPMKALGSDAPTSVNEYTKKGSKVFLEYFYPEGYEVCAEYGKDAINKHGIWKIVDNKNDADFILSVVNFYKVYPNPIYGDQIAFEAYPIISDKNNNLLWRGKNVFFIRTVFESVDYRIQNTQLSLIKSLIKELPKAQFSNTSIYCKNYVASRYIMPAEIADDYQFFISNDSTINDKKALKHLAKALKNISKKYGENKYVLELQIKIDLLLRDDNSARKNIKLLCIIDPLNAHADSYYVESFRIKYENQSKMMMTWSAIGAGFNAMQKSLDAYNRTTMFRSPNPVNIQSGKTQLTPASPSAPKEEKSPEPIYTDLSACHNRECKNGYDQYHKEKCTVCNGTSQVKYNNVLGKWVSSDF